MTSPLNVPPNARKLNIKIPGVVNANNARQIDFAVPQPSTGYAWIVGFYPYTTFSTNLASATWIVTRSQNPEMFWVSYTTLQNYLISYGDQVVISVISPTAFGSTTPINLTMIGFEMGIDQIPLIMPSFSSGQYSSPAGSSMQCLNNPMPPFSLPTTLGVWTLAPTGVVGSPVSINLNKQGDGLTSNLFCQISTGARVSAIPTQRDIGVFCDVTNQTYQLGHKELNASTNEHEYIIGWGLLNGIPSGNLNLTVAYRHASNNTSTPSIDNNDWLNFMVQEVPR